MLSSFLVRPGRIEDSGWLSEQDKSFAQELIARGVTGIKSSCLTEAIVREHSFGPSPFFHTLIAENQGKRTGYIIYVPSYDTGHASPGFELIDIYVRPEERKSGIALHLLDALKEICREKGGSFIKWKFETDNDQAIGFYKKAGAQFSAEERLGYLWF